MTAHAGVTLLDAQCRDMAVQPQAWLHGPGSWRVCERAGECEVGGGGGGLCTVGPHVILRSSIAISSLPPLTAKVIESTTEVLIGPGMFAESV